MALFVLLENLTDKFCQYLKQFASRILAERRLNTKKNKKEAAHSSFRGALLKKLLWKVCLINFISNRNNLRRHCVFSDSLLILSYAQGALRKELLMARFLELFENATLGKSYK